MSAIDRTARPGENRSSKRGFKNPGVWLLGMGAALAVAIIVLFGVTADDRLQHGSEFTGYGLFAVVVLLMIFNLRKRLPVVARIRVRWWLLLHVVFGVAGLGLFVAHVDTFWPEGLYERALALLFYLVSLSGILGYVGQRFLARRLAELDDEFIYERVPEELARIRSDAEALVVQATEATRNDTLSRHYLETMSWFFQRPRFLLDHLLGRHSARRWVDDQVRAISRYLSDEELGYLTRIAELGQAKNTVDAHFAIQGLLKRWLMFHVPLAFAMLVLAVWHLLLVNIYFL